MEWNTTVPVANTSTNVLSSSATGTGTGHLVKDIGKSYRNRSKLLATSTGNRHSKVPVPVWGIGLKAELVDLPVRNLELVVTEYRGAGGTAVLNSEHFK